MSLTTIQQTIETLRELSYQPGKRQEIIQTIAILREEIKKEREKYV